MTYIYRINMSKTFKKVYKFILKKIKQLINKKEKELENENKKIIK